MSVMDLVIINPNPAKSIYQGLTDEYKAIETPIWAGMLAAGLRAKNHSVMIIDAEAENLTNTLVLKRLEDYKPKLVAIVVYGSHPSASTQIMPAAGELCREIKNSLPHLKTVMLGSHISALPLRTLKEEACDYVVQGEGLYTLHALLQKNVDLRKVPGLTFKDGEDVLLNERAPLISQAQLEIDLPSVAYDLLPMDKYRAHNWHCFDSINERMPYASIYTSLGCPFHCDFCCINVPFGGSSFRFWRPEFIIQKFDELALKYKVKNIKIADEMFVLREDHFLKICDLLIERNYGLNLWAYSRIDTVKPHHLDKLKKAGVNWLVLGIESHSAHVRQGITKGKFSEADIVRTVRMIQDAGIRVLGNYIFGLPDDNKESMETTLRLAQELNCELANFYSAMAYPGSKLFTQAQEQGLKLPSSWEGYSQHSYECEPLPTKYLSAKEVLTFRDEAWKRYHQSERYLKMVQDKFGMETYQHMLKLSEKTLKRKILES